MAAVVVAPGLVEVSSPEPGTTIAFLHFTLTRLSRRTIVAPPFAAADRADCSSARAAFEAGSRFDPYMLIAVTQYDTETTAVHAADSPGGAVLAIATPGRSSVVEVVAREGRQSGWQTVAEPASSGILLESARRNCLAAGLQWVREREAEQVAAAAEAQCVGI